MRIVFPQNSKPNWREKKNGNKNHSVLEFQAHKNGK